MLPCITGLMFSFPLPPFPPPFFFFPLVFCETEPFVFPLSYCVNTSSMTGLLVLVVSANSCSDSLLSERLLRLVSRFQFSVQAAVNQLFIGDNSSTSNRCLKSLKLGWMNGTHSKRNSYHFLTAASSPHF